jgi:hypothetical protein
MADSDTEEGPTLKKGGGKRGAKKSNAVSHPTTARKGPSSSGRPTISMKGPVTAPAFVPVDEDAKSTTNFGDGSETAATQEGPDAQGLPQTIEQEIELGMGEVLGEVSDALSSLSDSQFQEMEEEVEQEMDIARDDPEDSDFVPGSGSKGKARGKRGSRK